MCLCDGAEQRLHRLARRRACRKHKALAFDEKLPVGAETKELLCVGNESRMNVKVQLVASEKEREKATYRAQPGVVGLERGMACEFEVFVMPLGSTSIDDPALLVAARGGGQAGRRERNVSVSSMRRS